MKFRRTGPAIRISFALRGIGGRAPAEEAAGAMETLLRRMQVRRDVPPAATTVKAVSLADLYRNPEVSSA